jgi:hypothetical protein
VILFCPTPRTAPRRGGRCDEARDSTARSAAPTRYKPASQTTAKLPKLQPNHRDYLHRYHCEACSKWFIDTTSKWFIDTTGTFLEASNVSLRRWVYFAREMDTSRGKWTREGPQDRLEKRLAGREKLLGEWPRRSARPFTAGARSGFRS